MVGGRLRQRTRVSFLAQSDPGAAPGPRSFWSHGHRLDLLFAGAGFDRTRGEGSCDSESSRQRKDLPERRLVFVNGQVPFDLRSGVRGGPVDRGVLSGTRAVGFVAAGLRGLSGAGGVEPAGVT